MNKVIITAVSLFAAATFVAGTANASYGSVACQPIYGGGQTCATTDKVVLDKKVLNPNTKTKGGVEAYVDNLSINDAKFQAGQTVKFQLTVTNTSDSKLNKVTVEDTLPAYLDYVSGPGSFDTDSKTVSFEVSNLNVDESRKFIIETKVVSADKLPTGQAVSCLVNQAVAKTSNNESRDNSQFCVEKTVVTTKGGIPVMDTPKGITKTPSTGPEMLALIGLLPAAGAGLFLRRKASK